LISSGAVVVLRSCFLYYIGQKDVIINFFIDAKKLLRLTLTLVDRLISSTVVFTFSLFANFRRLSSFLFPLSSQTQKLAKSRTRRPKKEFRSQKKRSNLLFHSSQRTKNIQRLKTKCSRSRLPVARYVRLVPLFFFRANVVSKRGFRVRVRVAGGGSVARNFAR